MRRSILIGAHALAYDVEARLTEDIDVFVEASPRNAKRLRRALETFGIGLCEPNKELSTLSQRGRRASMTFTAPIASASTTAGSPSHASSKPWRPTIPSDQPIASSTKPRP